MCTMLYKCYTNVLCLLGVAVASHVHDVSVAEIVANDFDNIYKHGRC